MFDRRLVQNFDWVLLLLLFILASISILNLYSATYAVRNVGGSQVFVRQIYWFLIGFFVFLLMTTFNYYVLERLAYPAYFFSLGLLVLVLFIGKVTCGSQRWLSMGSFSFQPSELAKIAIVMVLAKFFSDREGDRGYRLRDLWQPFLLIGLLAGLILKEPDLGTALLLVAVSLSIIVFVGIRWKSLVIMVLSALSVTPFIWFNLKSYQRVRILTFIRPRHGPSGGGVPY